MIYLPTLLYAMRVEINSLYLRRESNAVRGDLVSFKAKKRNVQKRH